MLFQREIRHLLVAFAAAFTLFAAAAAYWAVYGSDGILRRDDNPRLIQALASVRRGMIVDRHGATLAYSEPISAELQAPVQRIYPVSAAYSALGYYSLRYGASGVEAALDGALNGSARTGDLAALIDGEVLHRPRVGDDIRLTLDLAVQEALFARMDGLTGAAVIIDVPTGAVRGLISLPSIDPNVLDAEWEALIEAPGDPFFNRALQGRYQPGGALQTPLLAAALLTGMPLDVPIENAAAPYPLDDLTLTCASAPEFTALTLLGAYRAACPSPFAGLVESLEGGAIESVFSAFQLDLVPVLPGYTSAPLPTTTPTPPPPNRDRLARALGQGALVVTPLRMAAIAAGIANDGDMPAPTLIDARRAPGSPDWEVAVSDLLTTPIATHDTAERLRAAMQIDEALSLHVSLAYSGDETLVWAIGFMSTPSGDRELAIALVIENSSDAALAESIARDALTAAVRAASSP